MLHSVIDVYKINKQNFDKLAHDAHPIKSYSTLDIRAMQLYTIACKDILFTIQVKKET